jgi:hypothetical protein
MDHRYGNAERVQKNTPLTPGNCEKVAQNGPEISFLEGLDELTGYELVNTPISI